MMMMMPKFLAIMETVLFKILSQNRKTEAEQGEEKKESLSNFLPVSTPENTSIMIARPEPLGPPMGSMTPSKALLGSSVGLPRCFLQSQFSSVSLFLSRGEKKKLFMPSTA